MMPHEMLVKALPIEAISGCASRFPLPKYFSYTRYPWRTTTRPPCWLVSFSELERLVQPAEIHAC